MLTPLLQKFINHSHYLVRKAGLVPIVWEELLLTWNLTLGQDVVVQTWLDDTSLSEVTERGHKALFGDYEHWVSGPSLWIVSQLLTLSLVPSLWLRTMVQLQRHRGHNSLSLH